MRTVTVSTTDDFLPGVVLTELRSNNLNHIERLSEVSIVNNSGSDVTITDINGVVTNHLSTMIIDDTLATLDVPLTFKGIIIVCRRSLKPTDLNSTMRYYEKISSKVKITAVAMDTHTALLNVRNVNRLRDYYIVYAISIDELLIEKSLFIRGPNLLVSVPGMELKSPLLEDKNPINIFNTTNAFNVSAVYYNSHPDTLYMNVLGSVVRLDSVEPNDSYEVGVILDIRHDSYSERLLIGPKEYSSKNIYKSYIEAKNKLDREEYLTNRKMDLEYMKTESSIMLTTLTEAVSLYKNRMELTGKLTNLIIDRDKLLTAKQAKCVPDKLDTIKKVVDVVSMIKKLIF